MNVDSQGLILNCENQFTSTDFSEVSVFCISWILHLGLSIMKSHLQGIAENKQTNK